MDQQGASDNYILKVLLYEVFGDQLQKKKEKGTEP
jgi:hypothetical protein